MAAKKAKKTYTQKWREYNAAQTNEKFKFLRLLHELCQGVIEPAQCFGRPRQRLGDMLFCMALKVYTKFPTRRSIPDLKLAYDNGFISRVPGYNTISTYSAQRKLTRYLEQMITESKRYHVMRVRGHSYRLGMHRTYGLAHHHMRNGNEISST